MLQKKHIYINILWFICVWKNKRINITKIMELNMSLFIREYSCMQIRYTLYSGTTWLENV